MGDSWALEGRFWAIGGRSMVAHPKINYLKYKAFSLGHVVESASARHADNGRGYFAVVREDAVRAGLEHLQKL